MGGKMSKLLKELDDILLKILESNNYSINEISKDTDKFNDVLFHYLNLLKRQFKMEKIKKIAFSNELKKKLRFDSKQNIVVHKIKKEMINGNSLLPYTSTLTNSVKDKKKRNELDKLLSDWGIFHFHLGVLNKGDKYSGRTGALLFVYVQGERAYFLDILTHNDFTNHQLLEIIYNNWKEILKKFALKELISCKKNKAIEIRKKNSIALYTVNDLTIFPLGGGFNSYGSSIILFDFCDRIKRWIIEIEKDLNEKKIEKFELINRDDELFINLEDNLYQLPLNIIPESRKIWI